MGKCPRSQARRQGEPILLRMSFVSESVVAATSLSFFAAYLGAAHWARRATIQNENIGAELALESVSRSEGGRFSGRLKLIPNMRVPGLVLNTQSSRTWTRFSRVPLY